VERITTDEKAIELIKKLYKLIPDDEEEWGKVLEMLDNYQPGLVDIIITAKPLLEPKEALRIAREKNKPILL